MQVGRDILFVQVVSHNELFMFIIAVNSEFVLNNLSSGASTSPCMCGLVVLHDPQVHSAV